MKILLLCFILNSFITDCFAQNEFKVYIGGGFEDDTITLLASYYLKGEKMKDTLVFQRPVRTDRITGLAMSLKSKYGKKSMYELHITINEKSYLFQTDKLCRKSALKIEHYHDLDVCFLSKGKFKFY